MRFRYPACVAAAAIAAVMVAAPAESQAPSLQGIQAGDNVFTSDSGGSPNVTIRAGGHVNFAYFMGNSRHNVVFTGALPTVCGSDGGPAATASALPGAPTPASWDGGCDFSTPGTYAFVCGLHSSMTGSVTVVEGSATPAAARASAGGGPRSGRERPEGDGAAARYERPGHGQGGPQRLAPAGARLRPARCAVAAGAAGCRSRSAASFARASAPPP